MFKTFHIENEKYEKGLDYDARQVRLAIVHTGRTYRVSVI